MPQQDNNPSTGIPPEFLKRLQKGLNIPEDINQYPKTPDECVKNSRSPEGEPQGNGEMELFLKTCHRELISKKDLVPEITALMREADRRFHDGSTRHYVRDVLIPLMEEKGLCFCRIIK